MEYLAELVGYSLIAAVLAGAVAAALRRGYHRPRYRRRLPRPPVNNSVQQPRCHLLINREKLRELYEQILGPGRRREVVLEQQTHVDGELNVEFAHAGGSYSTTSTEHLDFPMVDTQAAYALEERIVSSQNRIFDFTSPGDDLPISTVLGGLSNDLAQLGLEVPTRVQEALHRAWQEKNSNAVTEAELRSLGPFVRVRAHFNNTIPSEPMSDYLIMHAGSNGPDSITVRVRCEREHLLPEYYRHQHCPITATCLATLERYENDSRMLTLHPIFIYLS